MKSIKSDLLSRLEDSQKFLDTIELLTRQWENTQAIPSSIQGVDSHHYTLRILAILKNELNTYINSILGASLGLYQQFFERTIDKIDPLIVSIANDFQTILNLPTQNIKNQGDNYRSMLLQVGGDLRAVLISMSICVLELRHYDRIMDSERRKAIIELAEHVYIPLAHRLGFYKLKSGMEDLVLSYHKPSEFLAIKYKLKETESERQQIITTFIAPIDAALKEHGMKYWIKGRTKSIHSIYQKMQNQGVSFDKVYDLWAIRIIIDSDLTIEKANCWHAYSVVTNLYQPGLSRLRDWISIPRENGYESLHITVLTPEKRWVEVQIRTTRMDDEAENGLAAHWRYKGGKSEHGIDFWLANIRKAIENEGNLLGDEQFRTGKFSTDLYAFTPNGDLKKLKIGATVLDFAFAIHTDVGIKCTGGIVNGKNVGLRHLLRNGDQVNILTTKNQKPSLDWLQFVSSNRSKLKIKKALDEQGFKEADQGKEILLRRLKNWKIDFNQDLLDLLVNHYKFKAIGDLYRSIAQEKTDLPSLKKIILNKQSNVLEVDTSQDMPQTTAKIDDTDSSEILIIDELENINYSLSKCCNPIPGDDIFGFVTVSKGISIHRANCPNALELKQRYPYRIIPSAWKSNVEKQNFRAEIFVRGVDKVGIINDLSKVINAQLGIHIYNINLNTKGEEFHGKIVVKILDKEQLEILLQKLLQVDHVKEVHRFMSQ